MWNETASGWSAAENWAESNTEWVDEEEDSNIQSADYAAPEKGSEAPWTTEIESNLTKRAWNNDVSSTNSNSTSSSPSTPLAPFPFPLPHQKNQTHHQPLRENWAYFTYTPSISWSFRPSPATPLREHENSDETTSSSHERTLQALYVGYVDDEVFLGIGIDDRGQGFARVGAVEFVGCLRLCG